jgi:hypothetical protein
VGGRELRAARRGARHLGGASRGTMVTTVCGAATMAAPSVLALAERPSSAFSFPLGAGAAAAATWPGCPWCASPTAARPEVETPAAGAGSTTPLGSRAGRLACMAASCPPCAVAASSSARALGTASASRCSSSRIAFMCFSSAVTVACVSVEGEGASESASSCENAAAAAARRGHPLAAAAAAAARLQAL